MNLKIHTAFYIFFLSPDYVAVHSLRTLRSNDVRNVARMKQQFLLQLASWLWLRKITSQSLKRNLQIVRQ